LPKLPRPDGDGAGGDGGTTGGPGGGGTGGVGFLGFTWIGTLLCLNQGKAIPELRVFEDAGLCYYILSIQPVGRSILDKGCDLHLLFCVRAVEVFDGQGALFDYDALQEAISRVDFERLIRVVDADMIRSTVGGVLRDDRQGGEGQQGGADEQESFHGLATKMAPEIFRVWWMG
jgi:hypothetical protein